jgi:hypothetical protein
VIETKEGLDTEEDLLEMLTNYVQEMLGEAGTEEKA